ncbi:flavin reductase family protein [Azospirillum sp. RWY-5-1]|uniref:Flavin reductase family protein n=1 Tax=Azospirillum oleiclasticum TaxID=2735135 RepID=A0ABX2TBD0_9PROT|nr:flavin reductase family protein [Azospirillum oleiclasticum]NYZ21100.1 flavin reductase family protein [Azospirillum oleiclasticum]
MTRDINQLLDWTPNAGLADAPTVPSGDHKQGMRHVAASVSIIATRDGDRRLGLTATAVCSVTADPPRLVVFVNKNVAADEAILNSGILCVNVLAGDQEETARVFAGMVEGVQGEARFAYGGWDTLATGAPVLRGALANFDCRVVKVFDESTHHAFLCEVLATRERDDGQALIYLNGAFRRIDQ